MTLFVGRCSRRDEAGCDLVGHHEAVRARSKDHYWGVVLDAPDPPALGRFYAELLEWKTFKEEPNHVTLAPPDGVAYLAIQAAPVTSPRCGRRSRAASR